MRTIALALALWASLPAAGLNVDAQGEELQIVGGLFAPLTDGAQLEPEDLDPAIPSPSDFLGYPWAAASPATTGFWTISST